MKISFEEKLIKHFKKSNTAPFLFIGSGFSRRYLGLEDWEGLLRKVSTYTKKPFEFYYSTASGDNKKIASLIAKDFHDIWWNDPAYEESRAVYKKEAKKPDSSLKIEISNYLKEIKLNITKPDVKRSELEELKKVCIDGIITTNWDIVLEKIFPQFETYVGQEELLFSNTEEIGEIYKIHGCCTQPNSLVLTDEDYKSFRERNAYLAAKLITIFVEHPVVFIGYSLNDENILDLLKSITSCLTKDNIHKLKNNLVFVSWNRDGGNNSITDTVISAGDFPLPITLVKADNFVPVFKALSANQRKVGTKVIRKLKTIIKDMVKVHEATEKVYVLDIDDDTNFDKVDIVCGIGISDRLSIKGYEGITSNEIYEDIILDDKNYDCEEIISKTIPQIMKSDHYIPVFKYLKNCKIEFSKIDNKIRDNLIKDYGQFLNKNQRSNMLYIQKKYKSIANIIKSNDWDKGLYDLPSLGEENIDVGELKEFLIKYYKKNPSILNGGTCANKTNFRKLVRIYDWLEFGKGLSIIPKKRSRIIARKSK